MAKKKTKNQLDIFKEKEKEEVKSTFTDEQKEFIFFEGKQSLIFSATAGSGKTYSCVHRLKELLDRGVDPKKIIFFSFTKAAVEELKERVGNNEVRITTIHAFCYWMLQRMRKYRPVVSFFDFIDWYKKTNRPDRNYSTEKEIIDFEKKVDNLYDDANMLSANISAFKLQSADGIKVRMPEFYIQYCKFLKEEKKIDFSDMIINVRNLLKENKWLNMFKNNYDYVFIDEYQDTSSIQMEILLRLNAKHYYLIGDENQSIYGYSGSSCKAV